MVRNAGDVRDLTKVSFSFIPSLKCNSRCSFCMYDASPENNLSLDFVATAEWMQSVDWDKVIGWGLYGGEPFVDMPLYQKFFELLPAGLPVFVITNGTWSRNAEDTQKFLAWCAHKFYIIVSGTPEHREYQSIAVIEALVKAYAGGITYKVEDEEMHPMGRLAREGWACTRKCIWHEQPIRLGVFPTGDIILQNCDGVYPVVGTIYQNTFSDVFKKGVQVRECGCSAVDVDLNDILTATTGD